MNIRVVTVGKHQLSVAEAGSGGRPLLLLHGFTGAKEDFTEWLDPLADDGWWAVAPDHRGHGASAKPTDESAYSLATLAADALGLADALGWDHFVLLGHSMGGMVAQLVALAAGARVIGLVLMDTTHGPLEGIDPGEAALALAIAREQGIDALAALLASRESPFATEADQRVRAERPGYVEFGERKLRATAAALYAALGAEMLGQRDRLADLARLAVPTLVIVGEQDVPFLAPSRRMAEAIPGAELAIVPDAGHSPQFENPDGWAKVMSGFLAKIAAA